MTVANGLLALMALVVVWSFYKAQRGDNDFNVFDLIMERGKLSKLSLAFVAGIATLTWIMIWLTLTGDISEGYVGMYGSIVIAPVIAKLFSPPTPPGTVTTDTSIKTTTTTEAPPPTVPTRPWPNLPDIDTTKDINK